MPRIPFTMAEPGTDPTRQPNPIRHKRFSILERIVGIETPDKFRTDDTSSAVSVSSNGSLALRQTTVSA